MSRIAIVQFARLASSRIPNKLLQTVNGMPLIERAFRYMSLLSSKYPSRSSTEGQQSGLAVESWVACPETDKPIIELATRYGINVTAYDSNHTGRIWPELIRFEPLFTHLSTFDWIIDANIACHPFLTLKSYETILSHLSSSTVYKDYGYVFVLQERDTLWDAEGNYIHNEGYLADTKNNWPYYRPAHIAYCFPSSLLDQSERVLANNLEIVPISLTKMEQIDIDTEEDLLIAKRVCPFHYCPSSSPFSSEPLSGSLNSLTLSGSLNSLTDKPALLPMLDAIAIGTGPSFYDWIKQTYPFGLEHPYGVVPGVTPTDEFEERISKLKQPLLYGCGVVPNYINGLRHYELGDSIYINNVPDPSSEFHPGCVTYAGTRNLQDKRTDGGPTPALLPFADLDIPHGESSGGMALSHACLNHNVVGIIGFDGWRSGFKPYAAPGETSVDLESLKLADERHDNFVRKFRHLINYWQNRGRRIISLMPSSVFNPILEPVIQPFYFFQQGEERLV